MEKQKVAIIGSKDLAQYIASFIANFQDYSVVGFYDDFHSQPTPYGPILGSVTDVELGYKSKLFDFLFMGIGYNHMEPRRKIFESLSKKIPFLNYIHPSAWVAPNVSMGQGCFVGPGCIIDQDSQLGDNVFFFPGCVLAHNAKIESHCFFAPGVTLAGNCHINTSCFLGVGTIVKDGIEICENARTGAGAVVVSSISQATTHIGLPAKPMQK